jgi:hypothetical protein
MTQTFDPFEQVVTPLALVKIHNVLLVDVRQDAHGHEVLSIEHQGIKRDLVGGGRWSEFSLRNVGRVGHLVPMAPPTEREAPDLRARLDARGCYFRPYPDPSLRRLVELDRVDGDGSVHIGWGCSDRPLGFTAPPGLIPGEGGRFVPDETVEVTLRVPPEFLRECRRVQRSPEELLRGFVGDASGIENYVNNPRADGYGSNGSDERDMASAWIDRAYGMWAIDIYAAEAQDDEEQERQYERDDFGEMLTEYVDNGGQAQDLMKAVQALIDQQANSREEGSA